MIVIGDHGNAEMMIDTENHQPYTAHTTNLVPFIYLGRKAKVTQNSGKLTDIAPTMLYLLGIEEPKEMTGKCLLGLCEGKI
jgi:2,3-bisphosphoglycerate-independent phosphoglycerate mutase